MPQTASGEFSFEEWQATTLSPAEIDEVLAGVEGSVANGLDDLLVFFYPRDWKRGERIWTPVADRIDARDRQIPQRLARGQRPLQRLARGAAPRDRLMVYQHTNRNSFFTHAGIGKADGAVAIAAHLGFDLADCTGAGDATPERPRKIKPRGGGRTNTVIEFRVSQATSCSACTPTPAKSTTT